MANKKTNEEIREENVAATVSATENFFYPEQEAAYHRIGGCGRNWLGHIGL